MTSLEEDVTAASTKVFEGQNSVQTTDVGDDLTATASLDESAATSVAASMGCQPGAQVPEKPKDLGVKERYSGVVVDAFPRVVSAADVLEAFEDALVFAEPLWDSQESAASLLVMLQEWVGLEDGARKKNKRYDEAARRGLSNLIAPPGDLEGDNQKFICIFQVGLEDDDEFCLVKRILGKAGNNMRRIADECNAKVRLRGIGSGFLEGSDGTEANMPLQLNVSCTDYTDYVCAVDQVAHLLKDLYKHFRRYARSKGVEPPEVKLNVEEVRRDDLKMDQFAAKANRSPRERERDRKDREAERRSGPPTGAARYASLGQDRGSSSGSESSAEPWIGGYQPAAMRTLPSGAPMPTTPAGRRAAARSGGAAAAAAVSAAAREAEREERERLRLEREKRRLTSVREGAAAAAKKPSRHAPRGMGLVTRSAGDAQQQLPDGQLPIGANTAAPVPVKGGGKGRGTRKRGGRNRGFGKGRKDGDPGGEPEQGAEE